jgi:hypothetical protein
MQVTEGTSLFELSEDGGQKIWWNRTSPPYFVFGSTRVPNSAWTPAK